MAAAGGGDGESGGHSMQQQQGAVQMQRDRQALCSAAEPQRCIAASGGTQTESSTVTD